MEHPAPDGRDPRSPEDDGSAALEAALADPAFDELSAVPDPGRPEDPFHEPGAPHLALDDGRRDAAADGQAVRAADGRGDGPSDGPE